MQRYSFWQALPRTFYSKLLYQDVDQNWRGIGLGYLFLVCFICSLPLLYAAHNTAKRLANDLRAVTMQLPVITIKAGEVSIDKPMPYTIKGPETGKIIVVIDTSEQANGTQENHGFVRLSKNKLMITTGKNTTKTYELTDIKNTVIDQARIRIWVKILMGGLFIGLYLTAILVYFIPSFFVILFYAAIAKLFVRTYHAYSELCRLAAVALTPTLIFIAILTAFNFTLPYRNLVYVMLSLGYLTFAIEANRPHKGP